MVYLRLILHRLRNLDLLFPPHAVYKYACDDDQAFNVQSFWIDLEIWAVFLGDVVCLLHVQFGNGRGW